MFDSHRPQSPEPLSQALVERYSLDSNWLTNLKEGARLVVQTCRLMVGVQDYEYYLRHMRERHPQDKPMSRELFYRYCIDVRYPSADRAGGTNCC